MPTSGPENPRLLKIGSSTPRIYQLPFEDAVKQMVLGERNQETVLASFDFEDFYPPEPEHFILETVYSNERVQGVNLTRDGYVIRVADAEYVMYGGIARMNYQLLNKRLERGGRFLLMQSYLDQETYMKEKNKIIKTFPPLQSQIMKPSKNNKAS